METKLILLALFVIVMLLMSHTTSKKSKTIIFFGDSITEFGMLPGGYLQLLKEWMVQYGKGDITCLGAGVSGNKIYDLYLRLEDDVIRKDPTLVVIFIGVNDVWHKTSHGTGTDIEKFEKFYEAILNQLKAAHIQVVLCTILSIGEKLQGQNPQDVDIDLYNGIIRNFANTYQYPLCDLRKMAVEFISNNNTANVDRGFLTKDGVHLNELGNKLVAENIWQTLTSIKGLL